MRLADTAAIAVFMRRSPAMIRKWAAKGLLHRQGTDPKGRALYDLDEAEKLLQAKPPPVVDKPRDVREHQKRSSRGVSLMSRRRFLPSAAARGYNYQHRTERERRLAMYRPGDHCTIGGEPLPWWPLEIARIYIDLPHDHVNGGYLPGLACRRHNRGEPNRRRQWQPATATPSRPW
jgi:hypothetical protein